jgi:hypothetical protein
MENATKKVSRRDKRYKAKRLFLTKRYSATEICKMVGITDATMSKWVKKHGWKDPETAAIIPESAVFGFKHKGFYDYLKYSNPLLIESLRLELTGFIAANKNISGSQKAQLKALITSIGLDKKDQSLLFTEIAGRPIQEITQLKYKEAADLIDHLGSYDNVVELIIKKVNA